MLPGASFGATGRTPPLPPPGVLNERYSPIGNATDSKDHPNVLSRKLRVAFGSVLVSSENARVPCVLDSCFVGFFDICLSSRCLWKSISIGGGHDPGKDYI